MKKYKLSRYKNNRDLMLRNLATSLILYEKIKTTLPKAKAVKPIIEKMISIGKKDNISSQKLAFQFFTDKNACRKLKEDLIKRFDTRKSGFVRINRIGQRAGDAASMVMIELIVKSPREDKPIKSAKTKISVKTKEKETTQKDKNWLNKVSDTGLGHKLTSATKKIWTKRTTSK